MLIDYGSFCSGIEAASVAWERLGFVPRWFSEIEPFPSAVLEHHWPHVFNVGDMVHIPSYIRARIIPAPLIAVGGTPCQSYSVAGSRLGLDDPRGQLTLSFVESLNAIDEMRGKDDECIFVWENVPGVLSDSGNAFGEFLGKLVGDETILTPEPRPTRGESSQFWQWDKKKHIHTLKWANAGCVIGRTRAVAWRVIDAQYFGVAQRRRRLFVIGSARKGFDASKVLFEYETARRDIAPSREPRPESSPSFRNSAETSDVQVGFRMTAFGKYVGDETASTMKARDYKDATDLVVTYGLPGNWIGRAPEHGGNSTEPMHDMAPCLTKNDRHAVAQAWAENSRGELRFENGDGSITGALTAGGGKPSQGSPCIVWNTLVRRLTPTEHARLQAFPDDHCKIPFKGKPAELCADGLQYKAYGNSMAVTCMQWIGERICIELFS
jgi:DNA (cytosine-5)-methyltransferase 1